MEKFLGRRLDRTEIVHHKDEDKRNNSLENLAVIQLSEHTRMHMYKGGPEMIDLVCIRCGLSFTRLARDERHNRKQCKTGPFCGKSCAGKGVVPQRQRDTA